MRHRLLMKINFVSLFFILILYNSMVLGQTTLSPGDIAIIGFKTDNNTEAGNDAVKMVTLVDLTCGTTFIITDNNWNNSTTSWACDDDEFGATVIVTSKICAGSIIYMDVQASGNTMSSSTGSLIRTDLGTPWGTNYGFNSQGDNFFILQGTRTAPNFIYAFKNNGAFANGPCTGPSPKDNTGLPAALTLGTSAIVMSSNSYQWNYKCSSTLTGTRATLLAAIGNNANWTNTAGASQSPVFTWNNSTCAFSVTNSCTAPMHKPSSFSSSLITGTTATIGWSNCPSPGVDPGNTKVLVIANAASPVATDPTTGTIYTANSNFGSGSAIGTGFVVYDGTGTSVNLTGLSSGVTYHFSVYEYSCIGNCYNTDDLPGNLGTLPVQLVYFYVSQNNNHIVNFDWETSLEKNNKYFEIEASVDGINFNSIGKVNGVGNSNKYNQYHYKWYSDESSHYFRLKQVDFDGKFDYSNIVFMDNSKENNYSILKVFPQPATEELNILFNNVIPANSIITISDLRGSEVSQIISNQMTNHIRFNVERISAGVYVINIITDDKVLVQKINIE